MIDRNHPAVTRCFPDGKVTDQHIIMAESFAEVIREALPHLTADDLRNTPAGRELMAEAWEDGAQAGWGESGEGWNGEYTGRSGPPCAFRAHNPNLPNPYKETPDE